MPDGQGPTIPPPNELIQKLLDRSGGGPLARTVQLTGYLGAAADGRVRLYASLEDTTQYVELTAAQVLHSEPVPIDVLPGGAMRLWVDRETEVLSVRSESATVEARYLTGPITERHLVCRERMIVDRKGPPTDPCP
jgi:hypothetical protein